MFDTKYEVPKWGLVDIPHNLIDQCADRILSKVVVLRRPQTKDEARRQAEGRLLAETMAEKEARRQAEDEARPMVSVEEEELGGEEGYTIRRRRRLCYPIASVLSPTDHPTSAASSSRSLTYPRCPSNPDLVDGIVHTVYEHT